MLGAYVGCVGLVVLSECLPGGLVALLLADGVSLLLLGLVVVGRDGSGRSIPGAYVVVQSGLSVLLWVGAAVGYVWVMLLVLVVKFGACIRVWVYDSLYSVLSVSDIVWASFGS